MTAAELRAERDALNAEIRRRMDRIDEIARLLPAAVGEEKRALWETWLNENRATRPTRTDEWEEVEPPRYVERWGKWLGGRRVLVRCESRTPAGGMRLVTETRWQDEPRTLDRRTVAARTNELELWRSRLASVR